MLLSKTEINNRIGIVHARILNDLVFEIAVYCIDNRVSVDDAIETNWAFLDCDAASGDKACVSEALEYIFGTMRQTQE